MTGFTFQSLKPQDSLSDELRSVIRDNVLQFYAKGLSTEAEEEGLTALYECLSQEDKLDGESNSIANQKKILERYCKDHGITAYRHYDEDDGYSGTNFDRPGFQRMVKKYPDLERGESASKTGRDHIPPRVFKEMTRLTKQKTKLEELLAGVNAFNAKGKAAEIGAFGDKYIPAVEQVHTTLKKYNAAFTATTAENKKLKKKTEQLEQSLDKAAQESTLKKLADAKLHRDYEDVVAVLERIPQEVLAAYTHRTEKERGTAYGR